MAEQIKTTATRNLIYDKGFRTWLKENPETMKSLKNVLKELDAMNWQQLAEHPTLMLDSGAVELLEGKHYSGNFRYYNLKVSTNGSSFFLKAELTERLNYVVGTKGADEYKSTLMAKELVKDIPLVEVVEPLLGYQGTGKSFFVSKWQNLPRVKDYLMKLSKVNESLENTEFAELDARVNQIKAALSNFEDVDDYNMLYDPVTKRIVIYDLGEHALSDISRNKQNWFYTKKKIAGESSDNPTPA